MKLFTKLFRGNAGGRGLTGSRQMRGVHPGGFSDLTLGWMWHTPEQVMVFVRKIFSRRSEGI